MRIVLIILQINLLCAMTVKHPNSTCPTRAEQAYRMKASGFVFSDFFMFRPSLLSGQYDLLVLLLFPQGAITYDNTLAKKDLGISFITAKETLNSCF
jgi:hypothetical protein